MSKISINLDEILAQRAEATGAQEGRVPFEFRGETFTFKDPISLSQQEQDEIDDAAETNDGEIIASAWMGDEEFDRFAAAGGTGMMFMLVIKRNAELTAGVDADGRPTRSNRSQRRAAARKR